MACPEISTYCPVIQAMSSAVALILQSWALALNISVHLGQSNVDHKETR